MKSLFEAVKELRHFDKLLNNLMTDDDGTILAKETAQKSMEITNTILLLEAAEHTVDAIIDGKEGGDMSDGYHSFNELYAHRIELYIALLKKQEGIDRICYNARFASQINYKTIPDYFKYLAKYTTRIWKSKLHSDGSSYDGWFILGINHEAGKQITYHLPLERWNDCDFATELDRAPEYDGHTQADVLQRIKLDLSW